MSEPDPPVDPDDPGPSPQPPDTSDFPTIPPDQLLSIAATPGPQPLCYAPNPNTGQRCDLTFYHPGDHHISAPATSYEGYDYADVYWPSDKAPGPNPDPDPPWPLPDPVPPPDPGPN